MIFTSYCDLGSLVQKDGTQGSPRTYLVLDITNCSEQGVTAINNVHAAVANTKTPELTTPKPSLEAKPETSSGAKEDDVEADAEEEDEEPEEESGVDKSKAPDYLVVELEKKNKEILEKYKTDKSAITSTGWTLEAVREAVAVLESTKRLEPKKNVLFKAVENGGQISRSEVYKVAGYKSGRSLKGFRRPIVSIMEGLKENGTLPKDAASLLQNIFDKNIKTFKPVQGFKVPLEVVALMREMKIPPAKDEQ